MGASGEVRSPAYGEVYASSANVQFPFDLAASAAAGIWQLADSVAAAQTKLTSAQALAHVDFLGGKRNEFDIKCSTFVQSAVSVEAALRELANGIARAWAAARGQQDRINKARYVEHDQSDDGFFENVGEFFGGETDYGPPPEDPPIPSSPSFSPTREPRYASFENSMSG